jgi:hypothetical protein
MTTNRAYQVPHVTTRSCRIAYESNPNPTFYLEVVSPPTTTLHQVHHVRFQPIRRMLYRPAYRLK